MGTLRARPLSETQRRNPSFWSNRSSKRLPNEVNVCPPVGCMAVPVAVAVAVLVPVPVLMGLQFTKGAFGVVGALKLENGYGY